MSKYSILFEAEKYYLIGPFRFPIFEDLTPGESRGMELINKRQSKNTYKSMKLAQKIAKDNKMKIREALDVLSNIATENNQEYLFKYADDVEELTNESLSELELKVEYVTIFMRYRGQVKLPPSEEWQPTTDWSTEDTEALTSKRLNEIFNLITWERDGWPQEGNETPLETAAT